ncbi:MAG: YcgL domain-containing protein [Halioglobus sp.]
MKLICQIYRSPRKQEMYLYVDKAKGLEDVPEALLAQFGEPEERMVLVLTPEKKLARASVSEVLEQIMTNGFYLQMPPTSAELLKRDGNNG